MLEEDTPPTKLTTPTEEEPSGILATVESWVNWIGKNVMDFAQATGLEAPNDGSKNVVEKFVDHVEKEYTGPLHESILSPSVLVDKIDNIISPPAALPDAPDVSSPQLHNVKLNSLAVDQLKGPLGDTV